LAEQLNIKTRQGYLFGHPQNPQERNSSDVKK